MSDNFLMFKKFAKKYTKAEKTHFSFLNLDKELWMPCNNCIYKKFWKCRHLLIIDGAQVMGGASGLTNTNFRAVFWVSFQKSEMLTLKLAMNLDL